MRRRSLASLLTAILFTVFSSTFAIAAASDESDEQDTDTRFVNAKVVEVTDGHISVIARTGVEHVIAIDGEGTRVSIEGKQVCLKDVREGDIVTVELDEHSPLKFARNITVAVQAESLVARVP